MGCTNILTLTGLPCSGKTTIGNILSKKLGFPFIDLDDYIVSKYKNSISNIFRLLGENTFREYEKESLTEIIKKGNTSLVLSLGGGTVCYKDNLSLCLNNSKVIWLNPTLDILEKRLLKNEAKKRPLFQGTNIIQKLQELYKTRLPFYRQSHIIIAVKKANVNYTVNQIINAI